MAPLDLLNSLDIALSDIVDNAPIFLYLYDLSNHKNIFSSQYAQEATGFSEKELLSFGDRLLENLIHPTDLPTVNEILQFHKNSTSSQITSTQFRLRHKQKGWRAFCSKDTVFSFNKAGKAQILIGVAFDVTESKQYEKQLIDSEKKLRLLSQLDPLSYGQIWCIDSRAMSC